MLIKICKKTPKSQWKNLIKNVDRGFPGGAVVENLPANAGDMGSSPGLGISRSAASASP